MPIYEYECRTCGHRFEAIVLPPALVEPACPSCQGHDLEKLLSTSAISTSGTKKMSLSSAQKRNASVTRDKNHADAEYERKHREE